MEKFHNFAPNFTQTMHALSEIMTPFQTIRQSLASDLKRVNDSIVASLESPNALMNSVINRYLEKKGKQIRPMLVILSARLLGEVTDNVVSGAVAVELLHNASLIHDDVVDDTLVRRGSLPSTAFGITIWLCWWAIFSSLRRFCREWIRAMCALSIRYRTSDACFR